MPQTVVELFDAALALPESQRAELAEMIAATVAESPHILHPDWSTELHRRAAEIDSGAVRAIPWDEVCEEVHTQLDANGSPNG